MRSRFALMFRLAPLALLLVAGAAARRALAATIPEG